MIHILVAAAVPEGAVVRLPGFDPKGETQEVLIDSVENSSPRPGKITWFDDEGTAWTIGANVRVEVVSLP